MISVKGGTQTWSKAEQTVSQPRDDRKSISAEQQEQFFGDQAIGDVLNKVADPNWVDPAKAVRKVGDSSLDKDAFMKLLLTQMKNQDPTNPLQSHEMAAQLAQFTSLEKLTNISEGIDSLTKAQAPAHNFEALSLIGKAVSGDSSKIERSDDKDSHAISFQVRQDAQKVTIKIKNAEGQVVRTLESANMKAGKNEIMWNGKTEDGSDAPKGSYLVSIEANASNGQKLGADTRFEGVITGVNFTAQGPVLMIGKQAVAMKDVKEIVDPNLVRPAEVNRLEVKNQDSNGKPTTANLNQTMKTASNDSSSQTVASNLESVGMSREMINQLSKSGAKAGI